MMQLLVKGEPYVYHHQCAAEDWGRPLTPQELRQFGVDALIESYTYINKECRRVAPTESGADFAFDSYGMRILALVDLADADGNPTSCVASGRFEQMAEAWREGEVSPRIYYPHITCISSADGTLEAGGDFHITFEAYSLAPETEAYTHKRSNRRLYTDYAEAWVSGNEEFFRHYLHAHFHSLSDFCFDEIVSRDEFLGHFRLRRQKFAAQGAVLDYRLAIDEATHSLGLVITVDGSDYAFLTLSFRDWQVQSSHTRPVPAKLKPYVRTRYQTHGDHMAVFLADDEMEPYVDAATRYATLTHQANAYPADSAGELCRRKVIGLQTGRFGEARFMLVAIEGDEAPGYELASVYPYLPGEVMKLTILDVDEWDNGLEATVKASTVVDGDEMILWFFATDYFAFRESYIIGATYDFSIAALGLHVELGDNELFLEGSDALAFFDKIGGEPAYDEAGALKPLRIDLSQMVAYLPKLEVSPADAEFQSPARPEGTIAFDATQQGEADGLRQLRRSLITLYPTDVPSLPIYYRSSEASGLAARPLRGLMWLSGRIASTSAHTLDASEQGEQQLYGEIAEALQQRINDFNFRAFDQVNTLLVGMSGLVIDEGFDVDAFGVIDSAESTADRYLQLYATRNLRQFEPVVDDDGYLLNPLSDDEFLLGDYSPGFARMTPSVLRHARPDGSKRSIWEAFLLHIASYLLPSIGTTSRSHRSYLFTPAMLAQVPRAIFNRYAEHALLPYVEPGEAQCGLLTVCYWDGGLGLVRESYTFVFDEQSRISFHLDTSSLLLASERGVGETLGLGDLLSQRN